MINLFSFLSNNFGQCSFIKLPSQSQKRPLSLCDYAGYLEEKQITETRIKYHENEMRRLREEMTRLEDNEIARRKRLEEKKSE